VSPPVGREEEECLVDVERLGRGSLYVSSEERSLWWRWGVCG
jgi:hypothetical protein